MKIARKLKLNSLIVLALLVLNVAITLFLVRQMMENTRQLAEVDEPLEEAVLEMEINAGETAWAVLHYVWTPEEKDLDTIKDSEADFERHAQDFERLAETEEERALGAEVAVLYSDFKILGDEITSMSKRRSDDLQTLRKDVLEIDELIDEKLQPTIDRFAAGALTKLEAALDMEINIDEAFAAIEGYILSPGPEIRQKIVDSEADFERFEAQYRATALSDDEKDALGRIDKDFAEAVTLGNEIVELTDALNEKLVRFKTDLEEIDRILDDEIQPLIHEQTRQAKTDAQRAGEQTNALTLAFVILVFAVVFLMGRFVSKGVVEDTGQLEEGAREFSRGNLDHRIETRSEDELGALAETFNNMADQRKRAEEALRESEENLHITLNSIVVPVGVTD